MRWYVDLSTIGKESPTQRYCVDADQWQKALQQVRALRGDEGPLGNFSIELLDDGYRAIDPVTRTRFVVSRADDSAVISTVPQPIDAAPSAVSKTANEAPPARASNRGRASERGRMRRPAASPVIPSDPVPPAATPNVSPTGATSSSRPLATESAAPRVSPSQMPVEPLVPARPMQAETAFERMTGGVAVPLPSEVPARADAPTQVLGAYAVMTRRSEDPTAASPLTYRELGIAVPPSTTLADAEAIARAKFTMVRNAIAGAPKGQFIQLAIFDYEYAGRPKDGPPILTLTFKDWRGPDPEIRFPKRDGVSAGPSSLPPAAFRANAAMPVTVIEPASQALPSIATPATERSGESSIIAKQMMSVESVLESPTRETKPTVTQPGDPYAAVTAPPSDEPAHAAAPASTAPKEAEVVVAPIVQLKEKSMATLASAGNEVKRVLPTPTPSELRREAAAMAGDDDLTVVKDSSPPPPPEPTTMVIDVVVPARKPSVAPPAAPTAVTATSSPPAPTAVTATSSPPAPLSAAAPATISSSTVEPIAPSLAAVSVVPDIAPPAPVSAPPPAPVSAPPPAPVSAPPPAPVSAPPPAPPAPAGAPGSAPAHTLSDGTADWALAARQASAQRQESAPPSRGMLAPGVIVRAPKGSRKNGDELIADLFEACSDLGFVQDPLDGAEFVADLVMESIPSLIVLVSFFDINAREFAVVRQVVAKGDGESLPPAILSRASEFTPNVARTMRSGRAVVFSASECAELAKDPRWNALGIVPQTMVAAPVVFNGRFLGILEVCNPVDGKKLSESDGHALTYIGEQFGEFLAQRDLSVEPDYVKRPKLAQLARR